MPALAAVRASNQKFTPPSRPVAVFVGGTSGIGQGIAETFVKYTNGDAHTIIVGRNQSAADAIISRFPKENGGQHEFISCDMTLMANVRKAAQEISAKVDKINYLVMSPGFVSLGGRDPTSEGIDKQLALNYYARAAFAEQLAPLLEKAASMGEDARVLTVFGAGSNVKTNLDDLGLHKKFNAKSASDASVVYTDAFLLGFASRHPTLSITHIYPGLVKTNIAQGMPFLLRGAFKVAMLFAISPATCGENMFYALTDPGAKTGAFFKSDKAETVAVSQQTNSPDVIDKIWAHTSALISERPE